jgi:hypothetical protein
MDIFSPYVFSHHIHVTFDAVKTTIILYESRSSSAASRLRRGVDVRRGHASVISLEGLFKARFEPRTRTLRYSAKLNRIQRNDTELLPRLAARPLTSASVSLNKQIAFGHAAHFGPSQRPPHVFTGTSAGYKLFVEV